MDVTMHDAPLGLDFEGEMAEVQEARQAVVESLSDQIALAVKALGIGNQADVEIVEKGDSWSCMAEVDGSLVEFTVYVDGWAKD